MTAMDAGEMSRRNFLARVAAGAVAFTPLGGAAAAAAGISGPGSAPPSSWEAAPSPIFAVFAPIQAGVGVLDGWLVESATFDRVPVLSLRGPNGDVVALRAYGLRADRPVGVVQTAHFDLVVMNDGAGSLRTPEGHERALRVLSQVIRKGEKQLTSADRLALGEHVPAHPLAAA